MKKSKQNYFRLFSNCILVQGACKSLLCDIQLNRYKNIPNVLYDMLILAKDLTLDQLKEKYQNQMNEGIDKFIHYLVQNNWGFITKIPENFPDIDLKWDFPGFISNSIIDFGEEIISYMPKIVKELEYLGCESIQLRFQNYQTTTTIAELLSLFQFTQIRYIEFLLNYTDLYSTDFFDEILKLNERLRIIYVVNADRNQIYELNDYYGKVVFTTQQINSMSDCGNISKSNFSVNIKLFSEGQKYNTCLNRKVSIDKNGDIKNCPSMNRIFGNIKNQTLKEVIETSAFKELWHITKDQIEVCKDCEFRYICTDCRVFIQDEKNIYSKPKKCNYNPYEGKGL